MEATAVTTVSILEDQSLMRQSLSALLEDAGFSVVGQYGDPGSFLSHISSDNPAVAIIDLSLQDRWGQLLQGGLEVVKEVHQRHPQVGVLVFSGSVEPQMVDRCYQEGASGYLDKLSAERESLVGAVQAVARGERLVPMHLMDSPLRVRPPEPLNPLLQSLTEREREVLSYVAAGGDNLKIAALLNISERTVKAHVSSLYRKLGSENRTQLALLALQLGVRPSSSV